MVAVLGAVLVMAASIWIAIYLEPRLGMLPTRTTLARASRPACCRFRHGAAKPEVRRPVRCTQGVRAEVTNLRERGQLFRAVGDPQQRPVGRALQHRLKHGVGRGRVEVPGGFVEKQHGRSASTPRRSWRRRSVICRSVACGAPTRRFTRSEVGNSVGCSGLQASRALTSPGGQARAWVPSMLRLPAVRSRKRSKVRTTSVLPKPLAPGRQAGGELQVQVAERGARTVRVGRGRPYESEMNRTIPAELAVLCLYPARCPGGRNARRPQMARCDPPKRGSLFLGPPFNPSIPAWASAPVQTSP
jgi:hypothetical protein